MNSLSGCFLVAVVLCCVNISEAFWLPIFYSKKPEVAQSSSMASVDTNRGWGRGSAPMQQPQPQQTQYKDYYMSPQASMHFPMSSMQMPMQNMHQYSYDPTPVIMSPYRQQMQYMEPQFQNVKLVPCMCPLTQELIEQQTQAMHGGLAQPQPQQQPQQQSPVQPGAESTKLSPTTA